MATKKSGGTKSGKSSKKRAPGVSLAEADRRYVAESLGQARKRGAAPADEETSGLFEALESFGLSSDRVERLREVLGRVEVRESVDRAQEYLAEQIENAREYARDNPKKIIGGAAGVLVGASLLAYALQRAGGQKKSTSAKSSTSSKKKSSKKR